MRSGSGEDQKVRICIYHVIRRRCIIISAGLIRVCETGKRQKKQRKNNC